MQRTMYGLLALFLTLPRPLLAAPDARPESTATQPTITYRAASNRDLRVSVERVTLKGQEGFLPKDKRWLQLEVRVTNLSHRVVQVSDIKMKLDDGSVLASAKAAQELAKPPNMGSVMRKGLGFGVAGTVLGTMIFPPLALVASGAGMFSTMGGQESWQKRLEKIDSSMLSHDELAPGTSTTGLVYVPAADRHTALLVFYAAGSGTQTLTLARTGVSDTQHSSAAKE